jgi:hypothetical protein
MKKSLGVILLLSLLILVSCKKESTPDNSGTVTIDNTTLFAQTYYVYGFLFSEAKKVSTLDPTPPDITVDSDGTSLLLQANNLKNSFYKSGEYADASSAQTAFQSLTSASIPETNWLGLATPLNNNQVWIYRSGTNHYAKFRIISTVSEVRAGRNYAECTFEWAYQPDGTLTFPGK